MTREFKKEDDLSQLKLKLLASRRAIDSLDKCDNHHSEIEAEVEEVKSFSALLKVRVGQYCKSFMRKVSI